MPGPNPNELSLTLSGEVTVRHNGADAKTAPVDLVANSGNPVDYPRLGRVVWDFAAMAHKSKMPLDWEHKDTIGYINHFDAGDGSLKLSGAIIPAGKGPAAEIAEDIIAKMAAGVPYEASIHSEGGKLEKIAAGESVTVNGKPFAGPLSVLRGWRLASTAICKFGRDSETMAELRLAASKEESDMKLTDDQLGKVKLAFGQNPPADLSADNGFDLLLAHSEKQAAALAAADTSLKAEKARAAAIEAKLSPAPKIPSADTLYLAREVLSGKREKLITAGITTAAGAKALEAKFCGADFGDGGKFTLSFTPAAADVDVLAGMLRLADVYDLLAAAGPGVKTAPAQSADHGWGQFTHSGADDEKKLADDGAAAGKAYQDRLLASRGLK